MREVLISIVCLCYNHENYMKYTLDGFMNQRTDFPYEVIVHDDASEDHSAKIIRQYIDRYPRTIKGIFQKQNLMGHDKGSLIYKQIFSECKGKYVAFCEGDDCWIDRNKIQIQIDYMEKHQDCVMTAHNGLRVNCIDNSCTAINPYEKEKDLSAEELIMQYNGNLPTASLVVRKECCNLEGIYVEAGVGDIPLQMYCITKGRIHYIDRIMSLYRYAHTNSWTGRSIVDADFRTIHYMKMLRFMDAYNQSTNDKYKKIIRKKCWYYIDIILHSYQDKTLAEFDRICEQCGIKTNRVSKTYCEKVYHITHFMFDLFYISDEIRNMIAVYPHILIMGAGEYGKRMAVQLKNNGFDFDGFVVSDNQLIPDKIGEKNIWHLKNIPYELENTGVIVAVHHSHWEELEELFHKRQKIQYVYYFDL